MENLPPQAFIPIGVILAALIGGFFSVVSLIVSKEQKTSEFRQQWIDSLRKEISDHIAASITLAALRQYQTGTDESFLKEASEEQQQVASTFTSIKLRINPEDKDSNIRKLNNEFLEALEECRRLYNKKEWEESRKYANVLTDRSIPMLKAEWERVKRGENTYIATKYIAIFISAISLVALITVSWQLWPKQEAAVAPAQSTQHVTKENKPPYKSLQSTANALSE
ncbi:hypothetical protein [Methylophaga sp. OBS1]|uniref:hypothetical protein n=1 Tax=Methylophaga sp. OBS1 TaxID=2991933 RepID=UPI00225B4679|nr:hypothetical protein [Methylophaga sp. OBS1]MCX4193125.1 hypothetical protein [Methylophaga sp. OBS1]